MNKAIAKIGFMAVISAILASSFALASTVTIRPDGQGYYSAWTNTACGSGTSEWQCVDENPFNTTDYLSTSSASVGESFSFGNTGLSSVTINSVTLNYYATYSSSSKKMFQPLIRVNSTNYLGSAKTTTGSWAYYNQTYATNPATNASWTLSQVDNLEAGMMSYTSNPGAKTAQVYAVVSYTQNYPDSCSDTDGGIYAWTYGIVSGYYSNNPFYTNDTCADTSNVLEYYCNGNYKANTTVNCGSDEYSSNYCVGDLRYRNFTDYFCSSGQCGISITQQNLDDCNSYDGYGANYCLNSSVYKNYNNYYCTGGSCNYTTTPEMVEYCTYGCSNATCMSPPNSCSDSDFGLLYNVTGTVSGYSGGSSYNYTDYCQNSMNLTEYYCSGTTPYSTVHVCPVCSSGRCV
jgi:hypothetical protein